MKKTTEQVKLSLCKKVIIALNAQQKQKIYAGAAPTNNDTTSATQPSSVIDRTIISGDITRN